MKIELMKGSLFFEFDKEGGNEIKTEGGIVIPEQKDTFIRKVTLAGPNDCGIKEGDKVLLNPHVQLMEFRIGLKWYKLCPASMVIAIIRD
jgi:co-chaperonin GroES (HSP10)